jgi:hypothetical protein
MDKSMLIGIGEQVMRMVVALERDQRRLAESYQRVLASWGIKVEATRESLWEKCRKHRTDPVEGSAGQLVTASGLARTLGLNRKTVVAWYKQGRLPGTKQGPNYYFNLELVRESLSGQKPAAV